MKQLNVIHPEEWDLRYRARIKRQKEEAQRRLRPFVKALLALAVHKINGGYKGFRVRYEFAAAIREVNAELKSAGYTLSISSDGDPLRLRDKVTVHIRTRLEQVTRLPGRGYHGDDE